MRKRRKRYGRFAMGEDLDPMNFVSNMSDVMLILAVGIMLALILHWNVPINVEEPEPSSSEDQAVEFSEDDLQDATELPENMQKTGTVYYDPETGTYYIVNDAE